MVKCGYLFSNFIVLGVVRQGAQSRWTSLWHLGGVTVLHLQEKSLFFEGCEVIPVSACRPGLRTQTQDFRKQRSAPRNVEMRCDFIQEKDRRGTVPALGYQLGMR